MNCCKLDTSYSIIYRPRGLVVNQATTSLWYGSTKNRVVSTGPLASPFACLLAPLTRSLTRSLCSLPRSWESKFLMSQNDLVLSHSATCSRFDSSSTRCSRLASVSTSSAASSSCACWSDPVPAPPELCWWREVREARFQGMDVLTPSKPPRREEALMTPLAPRLVEGRRRTLKEGFLMEWGRGGGKRQSGGGADTVLITGLALK